MRKAVAISGVFLVIVGSVSLLFGIWYASTQGASVDIPREHLLVPAFGTDLLSLLTLSASIIALGAFFTLWAYGLKSGKNT